MKIAVALDESASIARHFGRSRWFAIFDVEAAQISGRTLRDNTFTAHARGECPAPDDHEHHQNQPHGHADIVDALRDCEAVLCCGMGWRAADELGANGIKPFVVEDAMSPEDAVAAYLAGKLRPGGAFCRCHE